jgi:hypothetical protein
MKLFGKGKASPKEVEWIDVGTLSLDSGDIVQELNGLGQGILKKRGLRGRLVAFLPEAHPGYYGQSQADLQAVVSKSLPSINLDDQARKDLDRGAALFLVGKMPPESKLAAPQKKLAGLRLVGVVTYQ